MMKKELIISKADSVFKEHYYLFLLLLLTIVFFSSLLKPGHILDNIHYVNDMTFQSENMHIFLRENGEFPLWTPYFYAGQPFLGVPEFYVFDLNFIYILIFGDIYLAMNLALISYFFLAGVGMYFLVREFLPNKHAAFVAALIFMFNGLMHKFILLGHLNILESYALIPFIFLFLHRALHSSRYVLHSIITAFLLALMVYSGGFVFLLFTILLIGSYIGWQLIDQKPLKKIQRMAIVSIMCGLLFFGFAAFKLLPTFEFTALSSRAAGVNYQEFLGNSLSFSQLISALVFPKSSLGFAAFLGFGAAILVGFGLRSFQKKIVLYCILLSIGAILLSLGGFASELLYNMPGFDKMRHVERVLVLFVFAASILAAFGLKNAMEKIKTIHPKYIVLASVMVILIELVALQPFPTSTQVENTLNIPTLAEIIKDESDFRIATMSLSTPIGASGYNYFVQHKIAEVKGGGGIWVNDYTQYLAIAQQYAPANLFGILNAKYIISDKPVADPGLKLLNQFDKCTDCKIWEAYGPYLYQNERALPRASSGHASILLIGEEAEKRDVSLQLLINVLNDSAIIVEGKNSVSQYTLSDLKTFDVVLLLSSSAAESDMPLLRQFSDLGGLILPNVIEGKNSLVPAEIQKAVRKSRPTEIAVEDASVNEFSFITSSPGWILLSERAAYFPGWHAYLDGKEIPIEKANGAISAIYVPNAGELRFKYRPASFIRGKYITLFTMIVVLGYCGFWMLKKRNENLLKEHENRS